MCADCKSAISRFGIANPEQREIRETGNREIDKFGESIIRKNLKFAVKKFGYFFILTGINFGWESAKKFANGIKYGFSDTIPPYPQSDGLWMFARDVRIFRKIPVCRMADEYKVSDTIAFLTESISQAHWQTRTETVWLLMSEWAKQTPCRLISRKR